MPATQLSGRVPALALLTALPWLNPFAAGPSPAVQPWLASMGSAIALWLLAGARLPERRLVLACAGVVLWAILSQLSLRSDTVFLAGGLVLIVLAASLRGDESIAQGLQCGLLLAAALSAAGGLCQYFGASDALAPWVSRAEAGEAYGNLRQPNLYATLTWIGAAVLLWGSVRIPRLLAVLLMVLLAAGSAASVSRTGMLEGLMLTALVAWWGGPQRRQRLMLCAVAAVSYLAATWALPALLESFTGALPARTLWGRISGGDAACSSRLVLWSNVLHLIALKPLTGWGWGQLDYAHYMTLYQGARFCDILDNAHNLPLHLAVELGVPAALAICAGATLWAWRQRPWREQAAVRQLAWALIALVLVHSMLEYPLWYGPFQIVLGASIGWLAPEVLRSDAARSRLAPVLLAALLAGGTAYAAWDYERVSQIYLPPQERRAAWREDTLEHARKSWLFSPQARFADVTLTTVSRENAAPMYELAQEMLHYSPEPRVIERAIESATLLGRDRDAVLHLARFRAAFPRDYQAWRGAGARAPRTD